MDIQYLDKKFFFLINHGTANPVFDVLMLFLTDWGFLFLLPFIAFMLNRAYSERSADNRRSGLSGVLKALFIALCSFVLADWLAYEIKHAIGRIRPCTALEGVRLLAGCTGSYSMPSNHAANSFAAAFPLFYFARGYIKAGRSYPLVVAFCIAYSRVYIGVHYPADVLAGALGGSVLSYALIRLYHYAAERDKTDPYTTLLAAGLVALTVFRIYYILRGPLDLGPDEAHYWEWSRRLDLSYYSKGPMIAYLIYAGTAIFGDTVFGIRIMAVVFSALSSMYLYKLATLMYQEREGGGSGGTGSFAEGGPVALSSALLLQVIPLFAPFGVIFTIDSPFIFFWIASLYYFWKAVNTKDSDNKGRGALCVMRHEPKDKDQESLDASRITHHASLKYWLALGVAVGLGLLTKYTMALFYLCGFLFLILSDKRYLLKTARPYAAVLISLLCFSPVILWNMGHDWITFRHTAGQAHVTEGFRLSLKSFLEFAGSQAGAVTPILLGMMLYALFKLYRSGPDRRSQFLFFFSVPVVGLFLLKSLQGKVQANWAMTGYITGIVAFARYFLNPEGRKGGDHISRRARYGMYAAVGLALLVTVVAYYPSIVKLPPRLDPSSRLRGWDELGREVDKACSVMGGQGSSKILIFSDSYQVASELAFYVKGHPTTYAINLGRRMNQYDLWPDMNSDAAAIRGDGVLPDTINGIFVKIGIADIPPEVARAFDEYERDILRVYERGYLLREYSIFMLRDFRGLRTGKPGTY